jgi:hypothetical protein
VRTLTGKGVAACDTGQTGRDHVSGGDDRHADGGRQAGLASAAAKSATRETRLEREVEELKAALGEATVELRVWKRALSTWPLPGPRGGPPRRGDAVSRARDAVRAFLIRLLGADGGVLIFDETGQAKKGTASAAAGRQYSGTMGRVDNVIVAVYTTHASAQGHALIDREL